MPKQATRIPAVRQGIGASAAALTLILTGCSVPSPTTDASEDNGYPTGHIHGMTVNESTNRILLATHDGLFDVSAYPAQQIGPTIDLMGFTSGLNGTLYASGHPGPSVDLPDPVGLIRSDDAGHTWNAVSLTGESDLHALTTAEGRIIAFDGQVKTSEDGSEWTESGTDIQPFNLAGSSTSNMVLATTEQGLQRSTDAGLTWNSVSDAPLLLLTAIAGPSAAGVSPDGRIFVSPDAGSTWEERGSIGETPAAFTAHPTSHGPLEIWVATQAGVSVSTDDGQTFTPVAPRS
ncbi:F510_1955 family glycosylhydrolase [Arthrobacter sp. H5]|uniref:F510_1955 family glycosylhydrolase n=1 Tax=Arthrobacter sp. H5 TaxID=1267973 RepID=UPI0004BB2951|nr:sialidase family protein [Arthrobacter sp. H5]